MSNFISKLLVLALPLGMCQLQANLTFDTSQANIAMSQSNGLLSINNVANVTGWSGRSIIKGTGYNTPSSWIEDFVNDAPIGVTGGTQVPQTQLVEANSNAIIRLDRTVRTNSNANVRGIRNNSNTLLFLHRTDSTAIVSLTRAVRTDSNANVRGIRNNSNALLFGSRTNSNAIVALSTTVRTNSNADVRGIRNNSNALLFGNKNNSNTLLFLERTDSNAKLFFHRTDSNAIIALNNSVRTNSNALLFLNKNNSNAINNITNQSSPTSLAAQIRTLSNSLLYLDRTDSNAKLFFHRTDSNAIIALNNSVRTNSNALLFLNKNNSNAINNITNQSSPTSLAAQIRTLSNSLLYLDRTDSNAKLFFHRTDSNAIIVLNNSVRTNSNALLFLNKNNSNTINNITNPSSPNSFAAQIRTLSNSLLYLDRTDSNAKLFFHRTDSNAIIVLNNSVRTNSNALLFLNKNTSNSINNITNPSSPNSFASQIRALSNTILYLDRTDSNAKLFLTRNNSNALLFLNRNNSNTLLALTVNDSSTNAGLAAAVRANSNTLLFLNRNNSNALLLIERTTSNAINNIVNPLGNGDISGVLNLYECLCLGPNERINIVGDACINGNGVDVEFTNQPFSQFIVRPGVNVILQNITLTSINQNTFDLRNNASIQIGENVRWQLDTDVTFSASALIQILDGTDVCTPVTGGTNVFTIRGQTCRRAFEINPVNNVLINGQPAKTFDFGHNTLMLESAQVSGFDYMTFLNDNVAAAAIALSGNAGADISSKFPDNNGNYSTATNFFIEGLDNDLILRQDGFILSGNITFGEFPDNDLNIRFNLAALLDPSSPARVDVMADFPVVEFAGNPGLFLFSSGGVAELNFQDFNAAVRGGNDNAFVVDDNGLLEYARLQILDFPIKQQSALFRFEGDELIGQGIDAGFIRSPRILSGNILITAMHIMRQREKDMLMEAQKQAQARPKTATHGLQKPAAAKKGKKRPNQSAKFRNEMDIDLMDIQADEMPVLRALDLPTSFDQSYVGQVLNLTTPILGNIQYNRTVINNFIVDASDAFNILIQNGTIITLGAEVVLNSTQIINVQGPANVIIMPYDMKIGPNNLFLAPDAELTIQFVANTKKLPELTIADHTVLDIGRNTLLRLSGPGLATLGDDVRVRFKGVKTIDPVTKVGDVKVRGYLQVTQDAILRVASGAFARMDGIGSVAVNERGTILLDNPSTLAIGSDSPTVNVFVQGVDPIYPTENYQDFIFNIFDDGQVKIMPGVTTGGARAYVSFRYVKSSISFENAGLLFVDDNGTFEINAIKEVPAPSWLDSLSFFDGHLVVRGSGIFAMGSNKAAQYPATGQPYPFYYTGVGSVLEGTGQAQFIASKNGLQGTILPTAAARDEIAQQTAQALISSLIGLM